MMFVSCLSIRPAGFPFAAHGPLRAAFARARDRRERTVPTAMPSASAAAVYSSPSHRHSARTSRSGRRSTASARSAAAMRRRSSSRPATSSAWSGRAVSAAAAARAAAR